MRTLAIECATEACSAALFDGTALVDGRCEVLGRGHAERLVPMIAELPDKGRADRILVSLGPGSFTGVRIGIAAARALGLAWGAEVLGYPTLALVVCDYCDPMLATAIACMNGGHGEWFVQEFDEFGFPAGDLLSLPPKQAAELYDEEKHDLIVGNRADELAKACGKQQLVFQELPNAELAIYLPEQLLTTDLTPIYGRGPDATPMSERK